MLKAIILLAIISGCARIPEVHWVKPGATLAQTNKALAKCQHIAMPLEACMQMEGWKLEADGQ